MKYKHLNTPLITLSLALFVGMLFTACETSTFEPEFKIVKGQAISKTEMENILDELNVPGFSIAVIDDFEIDWAQGYGVKNLETNEPVTQSTLFQAASISKPITALGALHLVEQGQLDLDTDIRNNIPTWQIPDPDNNLEEKHISLRNLLTHSAGLTVHGFAGYKQGKPLPTLLQILNGTAPANSPTVRVKHEPGSVSSYSGGGYVALQLLMENVASMDFGTYMDEAVLAPLNMNKSGYMQPLPQEKWSAAATGHGLFGGAIAGNWHVYPELAAAGLWTTPSDLAKIVIDIQLSMQNKSNKVLSKEMMQAFLTPQIEEWGLGIGLDLDVGLDLQETTYFMHDGGNRGFRAFFIGNVESGQGIVFMTNSEMGDELFEPLIEQIAVAYNW